MFSKDMVCKTIYELDNNIPIFQFNFFLWLTFLYLLHLVGILNVTYLAVYQGMEGELVRIDIQWIDVVSIYIPLTSHGILLR